MCHAHTAEPRGGPAMNQEAFLPRSLRGTTALCKESNSTLLTGLLGINVLSMIWTRLPLALPAQSWSAQRRPKNVHHRNLRPAQPRPRRPQRARKMPTCWQNRWSELGFPKRHIGSSQPSLPHSPHHRLSLLLHPRQHHRLSLLLLMRGIGLLARFAERIKT